MTRTQEIEILLKKNDWSILASFSDVPIEGKVETYDVSGALFPNGFEFNIHYYEIDSVIVCKILMEDKSTFSSLRIYSHKIA